MLLCAFLWLSWQGPLTAEGPPEPIYFIEEMVVTQNRWVSRNIVLSQARMDEGQAYPESFLREAMGRIRQLPFVRYASFRLERGSERGKYRLNIRLEEAFPLFFDMDVRRSKLRPDSFFDQEDLSLGGRHFLGKSALIYASFRPPWRKHVAREELLQTYTLGFTEFDSFGRGIFLNLSAEVREGGFSPFGDLGLFRFKPTQALFLATAFPLGEHQWLRFEAAFQRRRHTFQRFGEAPFLRIADDRDLSFDLAWEWNTTDDAVRPQRGLLVRGGFGWSGQRLDWQDNGVRTVNNDPETHSIFGEVEHFLPIARSHSIFGGIDFRSKYQNSGGNGFDELTGGLFGGYQFQPKIHWLNRRFGDWYFGVQISQRYGETDSENITIFRPRNNEGVLLIETIRTSSLSEIFASWRGKWGLLRFSYRWERSTFKSTVFREGFAE